MNSEERKEIQDLVDVLNEQNLNEIEVQRGDVRIRIRRESGTTANGQASSFRESGRTPQPTTDFADKDSSRLLTVVSPVVGTFYRSSSPDVEPYVEEGDLVNRGQVLCIVEAMKLMNEIEAEADGRVVKILVENAVGVEYGQPLFVIEPLP
ncbi:MAG: acetyl-CoA carboxylase biotin carboxyl carrier protein [Nitrospira sp. SB0677_bin_15]|nr:acetyl-CoA carboxylase biotin carboxyl carrier protein [Nitrospira sp. SB0667_bin_9]MYD31024.1 acetyl-CoA carboxylase biotin carboxyl carrier protein [Nitrospira sp. SB0661_bin_20]MYG40969.1 acetyl-CoA carboxylase biotin carboxyl carrier protein [Nitrospira sp. SB0677_bin_15]MYH02123.1 acetyl-CoA carboxylase biotin carboxyl carrier protein [Nitrospira sp. SB0675_bin_23]MYJ22471.1 acetyl-CoA carboxylase biotin carboxyl carrier protein [Nitrospira sp. SB0673_bin_12]